MARIRSIKPYIWHDERIGKVSRECRLLFVGLITMADDDGRFLALPSIIWGHVYPRDPGALKKLPGWLRELEAAGLVQLYEHDYGYLIGWTKHQKISHRTPSLYPSPSGSTREPLRNSSGGSAE